MTDEAKNEGPALSVDRVSVAYGKERVVSDVSFEVLQGSTFGLMGLNGAGKTTLIKTILGLRRQNDGNILLFGRDVTSAKSKKELVYLPERFDPPSFLTGMEFLSFSASLYNEKYNHKELEDAASSLALDPMALKRRVQTYSKGMRQKLGLLGTLLSRCPFMILDEPMSGLDPQARVYVKERLKSVKKEGGTVFLSSHILSDMDEICDSVAVLHNGSLIYTGNPDGLKKKQNENNIERAFLSAIGASVAKAA